MNVTENIQRASATESAGAPRGSAAMVSPVRLIVTLLASAFVAEGAIMVGLSLNPEMPEQIKWFVDSALLGVLLLCPLWLFVYRPMRRVLSERAAAFDRLASSEERHRALFESSLDAIMTLEPPSWRFTSGNPATVSTFRAASEQDFIAHEPWSLSPESQPDGSASVDKAREMIETAMREGSHFFEWTHTRIGGEEFPATVLLTRMEVEGKTFLQATVRDITAQKQAEAALVHAAEEWNATFDAMDSYVAIIDSDCRVVRANRAMLEAFQGQEVIGACCYALVHGTAQRPEACVSRRTFETGESMHAEVQEPHLGNRWFDVSAFPIRQPDGTVTQIVHVLRDITDRKTAEATKAVLEVQLRQQQKMAAVGALAGGAGHEINNPINGIMNYAQLIKDRLEPDSDLTEFAAQIIVETERIASITGGLLTFAAEDGTTRAPAHINAIVESTLAPIRAALTRDHVARDVDISDGLPAISCNCGQIEHVLASLISNAQDSLNGKYAGSDDNKKLMIAARIMDKDDHRWIRTTVGDSGTGIPEGLLERVFEPFVTTKDRSIGAGSIGKGMGLFISYAFVQEHEGALTIESEEGQWTRVHMDLPIAPRLRPEQVEPGTGK